MAQSVRKNLASKEYTFTGFLTLHPVDGVKFTANWPNAKAGSRIMKLNAVLPFSMFETPELKLNVNIEDPSKGDITIDADLIADALTPVIGAAVVVDVGQASPEGE